MRKKLLLFVLALTLLAGIATLVADSGDPKVFVDHKGNQICVDLDSVPAHLGHGDTTLFIPCAP